MDSIALLKEKQRKECLSKRRCISAKEREEYSKIICSKVESLDVFKNAKMVLSYIAATDEADPSYIDFTGKRVCYPVCFENSIMKAYEVNDSSDIINGKYNIPCPDISKCKEVFPEEIDLVIVPCVGFDLKLRRLGHGKGYYDRFLDKCTNSSKICIAFFTQMLDNVAEDENDVPMDFIFTEK